jgi:putative membrane protein
VARLDPAWIRYGPFTLTGFLTAAGGGRAGLAGHQRDTRQPGPVRRGARGAQSCARHQPSPAGRAGDVQPGAAVAILSTRRLRARILALPTDPHRRRHRAPSARDYSPTRAPPSRAGGCAVSSCTEPLLMRLCAAQRVIAVATGLRVGRARRTRR